MEGFEAKNSLVSKNPPVQKILKIRKAISQIL